MLVTYVFPEVPNSRSFCFSIAANLHVDESIPNARALVRPLRPQSHTSVPWGQAFNTGALTFRFKPMQCRAPALRSLKPCESLLCSYCFRSTRTDQILFQPPAAAAAHCHSSTFSALHTPQDLSKTSSEEQCSSSHSFFQKCSILLPKSFPLKFCLSGKSLAQFHQGSPTESLPDHTRFLCQVHSHLNESHAHICAAGTPASC